MQYREDKLSGNKLSALGFGCMRFPTRSGKVAMESTEPLLLQAYEQGVNYFDTAYLYGGSEAAVGEVFEKHNIRTNVYIATKLPHSMCTKPEDFDKFFNIQLERLRTDYIDYYLLHNITELRQWERLCEFGIEDWIAQKKAQGAICQFGFSFHGTYPEFEKLLDTDVFDFVQIQYNYINEHYQAGLEGLELAAQKGLPVVIMEPLLGGKLADSLPKEAAALFEEAVPGSSPASWALKWVWNHPAVTLLLSGMNAPEQLEENLELANSALPQSMSSDEQAVIEKAVGIFESNYKVLCTGCNYCMPCPKEINIPGIFSAYNTSYAIGRFDGIKQYLTTNGMITGNPRFASDCVSCGLCKKKCPQSIEIPEVMARAKKRLQFPGMATLAPVGLKIARRLM